MFDHMLAKAPSAPPKRINKNKERDFMFRSSSENFQAVGLQAPLPHMNQAVPERDQCERRAIISSIVTNVSRRQTSDN